jgi:SAM-dependent methyltransferase
MVTAQPDELPIATNALGAGRLTLCLPIIAELDGLFGELRRVLRPAGTIAALVPSRPGRSLSELRAWLPLRRALGPHARLRNDSARDHVGWLVTAADFAVLVEQRRLFWLALSDQADAQDTLTALMAVGVLPADIPAEPRQRAIAALAGQAGPGRGFPIPLRLLVGRR